MDLCLYKDLKKWRADKKNVTAWPVENADEFASHLQEFFDDPAGLPANENRRNYIDSKILSWDADKKKINYLSIQWRINFRQRKFYSYEEIKPFYDDFTGAVALGDSKDGLITVHNKKAANNGWKACDKGFITTHQNDGLFILMQMVHLFNTSAYTGVAMALGFATIVLLVFTGNWLITALSVFCIVCVVVSVVGAMVVYGWTLGVIEAVCLTLVSGFSVDYIVHLGLSYIECKEDGAFGLGQGRQARVRFAFFEMGVSIFGGAVTTVGASIFLFFCYLTFFAQFGRFMCTTIVLSIVYANTLYAALLAWFGPEGDEGNLFCTTKKTKGVPAVEAPEGRDDNAKEGGNVAGKTQLVPI